MTDFDDLKGLAIVAAGLLLAIATTFVGIAVWAHGLPASY